MSPEEKNEYNKQYYLKNKAIIAQKQRNHAGDKVNCENCDRCIHKHFLERHQATALCKRISARVDLKKKKKHDEYAILKDEFELFKKQTIEFINKQKKK